MQDSTHDVPTRQCRLPGADGCKDQKGERKEGLEWKDVEYHSHLDLANGQTLNFPGLHS